MPPRLWEKGVSAEADAVAGILAGSVDNIHPVVAQLCEGLSFYKRDLRFLGDSYYGYLFLF
jgi:hypothetical protein